MFVRVQIPRKKELSSASIQKSFVAGKADHLP
jgi:hypothetical protein